MNIKEAKDQIKYALEAYFSKNDFGEYAIPVEHQRPVFMMGPPGIGKTAIMEQIAGELEVGLVSYSMTHHTRQSALGLPFIEQKFYGGKEYAVTEYTMSEIIASVYDMIELDEVKEGILFLDEINCVSETLAPAMLQFLQFKVFGRHRVPEGWIIVTAGNPAEYNNSVREFDIVTWDRLKRVDVEPDFGVWKAYAYEKGVHPAVLTYLEVKQQDFYLVESTVGGKTFVTARGWVDLSDMIKLYEQKGFTVDVRLVEQYLQNKKIAKNFAVYYDLFNKYRADYQVLTILEGKADKSILERAKAAPFDERLALLGLLLDALNLRFLQIQVREAMLRVLTRELKNAKPRILKTGSDPKAILEGHIASLEKDAETGKQSGRMSQEAVNANRMAGKALEAILQVLVFQKPEEGSRAFSLIEKEFVKERDRLKKEVEGTKKQLSHVFAFLEKAFEQGREILIFVTELTVNRVSSSFLARYGSDDYFRHNKELLLYERQNEVLEGIEELGI